MKRLDICAALVLLAMSAVVAIDTRDLSYWSDTAPGPAFAPRWLAGAGVVIGVLLLAQALRGAAGTPVDWPDRTGARQVVIGIAALGLVLILLPILGTALSGLIFMLVFLLLVARRSVVASACTAIVTVAAIESIFGLWLNIDLPRGIVGF